MSTSSSSLSTSSSASTNSRPDPAPQPAPNTQSRLFAKILFVVSIILIIAPCGLVMAPGGFPYAVACLGVGIIFTIFSSYLLCKK